MGNDRLRNALGFAMKAGKVRSGELAAEKAVKGGKAFLAVLDREASEQTRKRWNDICTNNGVPLILAEDVGRAIGKDAHMIACITDSGFSEMIIKSRAENEL